MNSQSILSVLLYSTALLVSAVFLASATCGKASPRSIDLSEDALSESLKQWEQTEKELKGNYAYIRLQSSMTGDTRITLARFTEGQLDRRVFKRLTVGVRDGKRSAEVQEAWLAKTGEKRLFTGEGGQPGLSITELYNVCKSEVLSKDSEKHDMGIAADDRGVLTQCFYSPKNCADDCGKNYGISHFYDGKVSDAELEAYLKSNRIELREKKKKKSGLWPF
jgi:hypothetical protein